MSQPTLYRDANGRFTAGNPGGPGTPFHRQAAARRKGFAGVITPEDLVKVAEGPLPRR